MRRIPSISLEQLGLDVVKLGVPSVYSVWVGVDSEMLCAGDPPEWKDDVDVVTTSCLVKREQKTSYSLITPYLRNCSTTFQSHIQARGQW